MLGATLLFRRNKIKNRNLAMLPWVQQVHRMGKTYLNPESNRLHNVAVYMIVAVWEKNHQVNQTRVQVHNSSQ